jgi:hypothetical protein
MFKIKVEYETGNSFNKYDAETILEDTYTKVETVKENVERIKNNYEYCQNNSDSWNKPEKEKLPNGVVWDDKYRTILLETVDDNGNKFTTYPDWVGYFETLKAIRVIVVGEGLGWER